MTHGHETLAIIQGHGYTEKSLFEAIMSLVNNRMTKERLSPKKAAEFRAILNETPMSELTAFASIVDSRPYFDVDGIYKYLAKRYDSLHPSGKEVGTKKTRAKNFNDWKPDADGVWRSKGRIRGMHSQRTQKEWGSAAKPARTNRE